MENTNKLKHDMPEDRSSQAPNDDVTPVTETLSAVAETDDTGKNKKAVEVETEDSKEVNQERTRSASN